MTSIEVRATAELLHAKAAHVLGLAQDPLRHRAGIVPALSEAQQLLDSLKRGFGLNPTQGG